MNIEPILIALTLPFRRRAAWRAAARLAVWLIVAVVSLATVPGVVAAETVTITEFLAQNVGGLLDQDGDSSDWIELYNAGTAPVNLAGWYLTDDTNELTKWSFPATNLAAKGFLLVFASGKDRSTNGVELHASFSLDPNGDYLALVHPDGVTIASQFAPLFPEQRANFSYGVAQSVAVTRLVTSNQAVKVLVPTNSVLGLSWISNTFDDTGWINGTNGVGYETSVPGLAVRNFKANITVDTLAKAEEVITNVARQTSVVSQNAYVINYSDSQGDGHYGTNTAFPGHTLTSTIDDHVLDVTATVTIPTAGQWSFGVNSDDGFRLIVGTNRVEFDPPRGPGDTLATFNFATAGDYPLRLVYYERGGGAEVELFAAAGAFGSWGNNFRLVGDAALGGLVARSLPVGSGSTASYRSLIRTDVQAQMLSNSTTAFIRLPFAVTNAATLEALTLQMKYDDGFVAYLNGVEVARRNAPASPDWNSAAAAALATLAVEDINLTAHLNLVGEGDNMLAILGLNDAAGGVDFLIAAELTQSIATGTTNTYFSTPTPLAFNSATGFAGYVADTRFSHDRGFYDASFSLVITSATAGATIRYTTNGSVPTLANGFTYVNPVPITNTTTLRAAAFQSGLVPSDVDTETYVFVEDVIRQSPAGQAPGVGWPTANSTAGQIYDYGMDPDIVNNPTWGATIRDDLKSLPSFSIVMPLPDLFDNATGIYANPRSDEIAWERAGSLELIYPDGTPGFQINCGVRIRGGFSRDPANPKHAFRFFFRQQYGDAKLNYPLFGDRGADTFDKIDLRTMQNYSWSYQNDARMIGLRDQFSRDAQLAMGQPAERGNFYHLYVNGQYWGLYNTDERAEASYGETYFGGKAEDYDTVKVDPDLGYVVEPTDGTLDAWFRLWQAATNGLATDADYFRLQGLNVDGTPNPAYEALLDVDNLIDYMLIIVFGGNLDAPISNFLANDAPNNWFGVRHRGGLSGGFKYFAHDSEHTLRVDGGELTRDRVGLVNNLTGGIDTDWTAGNPLTQSLPTLTGPGNVTPSAAFSKSSPQYLWFRLALNAEFRIRVADHAQKHFFNGGVFSTDGARAMFTTRSNEIYRAIVCESARWGDAKNVVPYTRTHWATEMNNIGGQYFAQRPATVLNQLRARGLFPAVTAPSFNQRGGLVPAGFNLYMTNANPSGTIYYTLNGVDPRERGGAIAAGALAYTPGTPITINVQTTVKARVRSNTVWSALSEAVFFAQQDFTKLLVTEIMYHPPDMTLPPGTNVINGDEFEFLELKNTGTSTLDLSGVRFTDGINFTFTNGTHLAAGQFFVLGRNAAALAAKYPGLVVNGIYPGSKLDNNGEIITLTHALGGRILSFGYKDGGRWPITPDGLGYSLVPRHPNANPDHGNPANWRASTASGGSPGADDPAPVIAPIFINEVLTHTTFPTPDAIELYNPNAFDVDIGGWCLTDDAGSPMKYRIADGTMILAGQYRVFTEAHFNSSPDTNSNFALASSGEEVYLLSGDANTNLTGYSHGFNFDASPNGVTFGRYVISTGDEHFPLQLAATPDATNAGPLVGPVVIRQIMYHPPDLAGGADNSADEFIELYNRTGDAVPLFDPLAPTNTWHLRGGVGFDFPADVTLQPGNSLVLVNFDPNNAPLLAAFRARYGLFASVPVFGPYSGKLNNDTDSVEIRRPDAPDTNGVQYILVEEVNYRDTAPWPVAADGGGLALHRVVFSQYANDPVNWTAAQPLTILAQPTNATANGGATAAFAVNALGSGSLSYQWFRNGMMLDGATGATLTLTNVQAVDRGDYTVLLTDSAGSALSRPATLTVLIKPIIIQQPTPTNITVVAGGSALFTIVVSNTATLPVSFRWRRGGASYTNIILNDSFTCVLDIPVVQSNLHAGIYTVAVTNIAGNPTPGLSSAAVLTVLTPPAFGVQPTNQTVNPGVNVSLIATAGGTAPLRFQWWFNATNLVAGATNATLTLTNAQAGTNGDYTLVVTNNYGTATSQVARITVRTPPTLLVQPASRTVAACSNVTFAVEAGGTGPLRYQWRFNTTNLIASATNSSLTISNVQPADGGGYHVVVTNTLGSVTSQVAVLTVTAADCDGDGMADDWETAHGLNPGDAGDAALDADNDGMSNLNEYRSGTDPQDALSVLKVLLLDGGNGGALVRFTAMPDRGYSLLYQSNILSLPWLILTNLAPQPGTNLIEVLDPGAGASGIRYYRIVTPQQMWP